MGKRIHTFDTTLRDGAQMEGITFSIEDKKSVISELDYLGIDFIECGMPQSNPTDLELFSTMIDTERSQIVAFGSTCRPNTLACEDQNLLKLSDCSAEWVCIFGKSWEFHIKDVLRITPDENLKLIKDSIEFLVSKGKKVIFDAEHYFDGYKDNQIYAKTVVRTASEAGAEWVVLCDTNGGSLPTVIGKVVEDTKRTVDCKLGIHCHNDTDLAVASTLSAIDHGAEMVQGTINGIGERCGNANLCSVIPIMMLKKEYETGVDLPKLTSVSRTLAEICNIEHTSAMPFVGSKAFTHKGGMHIDAQLKNQQTYEHISPELVGNRRKYLVSELTGKAGIAKKLSELGIELKDSYIEVIIDTIKEKESKGYQFEDADASLELLIRRICCNTIHPFKIPAFRTYIDEINDNDIKSEVSIKVSDINGEIEHTVSDGDGPVDALNKALKKALTKFFPEIKNVKLLDYKVRVLSGNMSTSTPVRVIIKSTDGKDQWNTIGVSSNIMEASLMALVDSMEYIILKKIWK